MGCGYIYIQRSCWMTHAKSYFLVLSLNSTAVFPPIFCSFRNDLRARQSLSSVWKGACGQNVWSGRTANGLNIFARSARNSRFPWVALCYMERIPRGEPQGQQWSREGKSANFLGWGGESEGLVRIQNPVFWAGVWCSQGSLHLITPILLAGCVL